jgi:GntR family transcriptional regulator, transcriptional repressor for pyruvate dehydrogenase complex
MLQKIKKETAVDKVIQQLRSLIESGEYKSGDKLPSERALCEIMSVSRIAIREAIRGLEAKNLLEVRPGNGTYVKKVTASDFVDPLTAKLMGEYTLRDLLEFRRVIEIAIVGLAAERAGDADLKAMRNVLNEMKEGLKENNDYLEPDVAFHNIIAQASGNKFLQITLERFGDTIREAIRETSRDPGAPARAYKLHYNIYKKIRAHDVEGAKKYMYEHLLRVEKDLLAYHKLYSRIEDK